MKGSIRLLVLGLVGAILIGTTGCQGIRQGGRAAGNSPPGVEQTRAIEPGDDAPRWVYQLGDWKEQQLEEGEYVVGFSESVRSMSEIAAAMEHARANAERQMSGAAGGDYLLRQKESVWMTVWREGMEPAPRASYYLAVLYEVMRPSEMSGAEMSTIPFGGEPPLGSGALSQWELSFARG